VQNLTTAASVVPELWLRAPKYETGHVAWPPTSGWFLVINLSTKFEVFTLTLYKDTKGNAKCRNWGCFELLGSPTVISNITIPYSIYDFLFDFDRNYLLYRFSSYNQLFVKSRRFYPTPPAFGSHTGGDLIWISSRSLASENYSPSVSDIVALSVWS